MRSILRGGDGGNRTPVRNAYEAMSSTGLVRLEVPFDVIAGRLLFS